MDKSKIQISYYVETVGNTRKITARLPHEVNLKVRGLTDRQKEIDSPHIIGEAIRSVKFTFTFSEEKDSAFVRFEIHKFVKNIDMVELMIKLAVDKLMEIK